MEHCNGKLFLLWRLRIFLERNTILKDPDEVKSLDEKAKGKEPLSEKDKSKERKSDEKGTRYREIIEIVKKTEEEIKGGSLIKKTVSEKSMDNEMKSRVALVKNRNETERVMVTTRNSRPATNKGINRYSFRKKQDET